MDRMQPEHKAIFNNYCFLTNNNFAYKFEANDNPDSEMKIFNFVPTYDNGV